MKPIEVVTITPPPPEQRVRRDARFVAKGTRKTRYSLPDALESASPVGYRTRVGLTQAQATEALALLSMERPTGFGPSAPIVEQALFEECSLGVLSSRQSTNFRGFRQVSFGPEASKEVHALLSQLEGTEASPLPGASYTHLVIGRKYRNPFTMLLTLVGHRPVSSLFTVVGRLYHKWVNQGDDIPTIGYLPHLHVGILADAMERAAVVASAGQRRAQGLLAPFCGEAKKTNKKVIRGLERLCRMTAGERNKGWGLSLAVQVGEALPAERVELDETTAQLQSLELEANRRVGDSSQFREMKSS